MFGINKNLKIHFIGIGGIGMSGIAEVLLNLGYRVSGSDIVKSQTVEKLISKGAQIEIGHKKENISDTQIIVYSSAIDYENPEIVEALSKKIPIVKRAEMLAELMRLKFGIAVAGSHGKTTTTSFLATILKELNFDPTHIIGGIVRNLGGNAQKGDGDLLIAEADESDGSFLFLNPIMSIITNIDNDHLDYYKTEENLLEAFINFSNKVPFYGKVALNANDKKIKLCREKLRRPFVTFAVKGLESWLPESEIDFLASDIEVDTEGTSFNLLHENKKYPFRIALSGNHNILNALGSIAIAYSFEKDLSKIASAILKFNGVGRRLEKVFENENTVIIDDYAHHPTEITATIETITKQYQDKKLYIIFEPHRFTRTEQFWSEFVDCFQDVLSVNLLPIYPASEKPIEGINSENLVKEIQKKYSNATLFKSFEENFKSLFEKIKGENSLVLTLGAGPISKNVRKAIEKL